MTARSAERRLAQWMLDVGTPAPQVFELIASTAGLADDARLARSLRMPVERPLDAPLLRNLERAS